MNSAVKTRGRKSIPRDPKALAETAVALEEMKASNLQMKDFLKALNLPNFSQYRGERAISFDPGQLGIINRLINADAGNADNVVALFPVVTAPDAEVVDEAEAVADDIVDGLGAVCGIKSALKTAKLNKKHLPVNHAEAEKFLTLLDEEAEYFVFQTFDDDRDRDDKSLARVLIGTYEQHAPALSELNMRGAGIFVTVNRASENGRTIADMLEPRVIFNEDDCGTSPSPAGLEPHIVVVSSPGKKHDYYLIDGATADWPTWDGCQLAMALDFGSDKNAVDRTRVLRLPGYYHQKDPKKPHLVYIRSTSGGQPYTMAQIAQCVPPKPPKAIQRPAVPGNSEHLPEIESALEFIDPDCGYNDWMNIGMALHHESDGGNNGFDLWVKWSSGDLSADHHAVKYPAKNPDLLICKWNSFNSSGNKTGTITRKTIFKMAQDAGWLNPKKKSSSSNTEPPPRNEKPANEQPEGDDAVLNDDKKSCKVNLLQHLDDGHLLKKMAIQISAEAQMPVNTVLLIGLGVFSSVATRRYSVLYPDGTALPVCINAAVEQPSAAGKSRSLRPFQRPFNAALKVAKSNIWKRICTLEGNENRTDEETQELKRLKSYSIKLFITNATPEGLEITLDNTKGFFSAVSSEQGLFDSLLGLAYVNGANNNDILLNGFDGGFVSTCRVGRQGYTGQVVGNVCVIAQPGGIEKLLGASNGTGVSERFLLLSEQHLLGRRNHLEIIEPDHQLSKEYEEKCKFALSILESPLDFEELMELSISTSSHRLIAEYRNRIEPHLGDGGKFSHISLRGAAGKVDMQIMKIAANLHLLDGFDGFSTVIPDEHVKSAIGIVDELLEANLALCIDKGIIGIKAEYRAIIKYLTDRNGIKSELDIKNSMRTTHPFKDCTGNKMQIIKNALTEMVDRWLLRCKPDDKGKVMYELAQ